jgi:hypothetical protein
MMDLRGDMLQRNIMEAQGCARQARRLIFSPDAVIAAICADLPDCCGNAAHALDRTPDHPSLAS